MRIIFKRLKKVAPYIFNLLDSNEDRRLDKYEAKYITKFEESFSKNDNGKEFVRECFGILDDDVDDQLSVEEILDGTRSKFVIGELSASLHDLLPVRDHPLELRKHIKRIMKLMWGDDMDKESIAEGMKWWDSDGDGYIQMREVGDVYNSFSKRFLGLANSIKKMGPKMAMLGGHGQKSEDNFATNLLQQASSFHSDIKMDL